MIIYALVSRGPVILADHATTSGNFTTIAPMILEKINASRNDKRSYAYNEYTFHYVVEDGLVFMAMADGDTKKRIPFAFLADMSERFHTENANPRKWQSAQAYELNDSFGRVIAKQLDFFNHNPQADKIGHLQAQIDDVKNVMVENIEKVLERGERIEILVDKSSQLNAQAATFKKKSTKLKRAMWWKNMKLWFMIIGIVVLVIFIIVLAACGGFKFKKCK